MGKGDARTKRGKVWRGSYGKSRTQKTGTTQAAQAGQPKGR